MKNLRGFVALAVIFCAVPCFAAFDAFILFENVNGESTDVNHKGWIEVSSFSWGMGNATRGQMGAEVFANGCESKELRFVARGSAVPQLMKLVTLGTNLHPVKFDASGQHHVLEGGILTSCQNSPSTTGQTGASCVMKFQRCSTHSHAAVNAAMVNPAAVQTAADGQVTFDTNPADSVQIIAIQPHGQHDVSVIGRPSSPSFSIHCKPGAHYGKVTLTMRKAGGDPNSMRKSGGDASAVAVTTAGTTQLPYIEMKLNDVVISSVTRNADGSLRFGLQYGMADGSVRPYPQ